MIRLFGEDAVTMPRARLPGFRRRIGVVFQDFRLVPHLSAWDNIALPLRVAGVVEADLEQPVREMLAWVGLAERAHARPATLSGGEQQRVAIARAVIARPELLVADEPTGNVDPDMADRLMHLFESLHRLGTTVVIDYGLWGRDERSALRQAATDRGAAVQLVYLEVSAAEQRRRLDRRQADEPHTTWPVSDEELIGWASTMQVPTPGELDGSEPIEPPPAGWASWDEWRRHRWPPSVA